MARHLEPAKLLVGERTADQRGERRPARNELYGPGGVAHLLFRPVVFTHASAELSCRRRAIQRTGIDVPKREALRDPLRRR